MLKPSLIIASIATLCVTLTFPTMSSFTPNTVAQKSINESQECYVEASKEQLNSFDKKLKDKKPLTWIFTGDSITHGAAHTNRYRSYPEILAERIRWEKRRMTDIIINTGISGNTIEDVVNQYDWRVGRFNPDIVFIKIGMNDCTKIKKEAFTAGILKFIEKAKAQNATVVVLTSSGVRDANNARTNKLSEYVKALKENVKKNDVILVDLNAFWNAKAEKNWYNDAIHPNEIGHQKIAHFICEQLQLGQGPCTQNEIKK